MNVSTYNQGILTKIAEMVTAFEADDLDLGQVQSILQSSVGLLENDGSEVIALIRLAEADIEEIRYTRLLEEQRLAAIFRLDKLVQALEP